MLRPGASPHEQQWRLSFTVSTMTSKGLDAKYRRTFNAEAEVAMGHFYRELAFSSVRDCVMFLDTVQQRLKESSGTRLCCGMGFSKQQTWLIQGRRCPVRDNLLWEVVLVTQPETCWY